MKTRSDTDGKSLWLTNPHSVLAVLQERPKDVLEVQIPREGSEAWKVVAHQFRQAKAGSGRALVRPKAPCSVDELFAKKSWQDGDCFLALDTIQDPQNLGSIFRLAGFFGVKGIVITQNRSAPISSTVIDVASGGVEYVPFAIIPNLQHGIKTAKDAGVWALGTSEHAEGSIRDIKADRPWLIVLGNEERGVRRLTSEKCDLMVRIPAAGPVESLNVAMSAAVLLSSLSR